MQVSDVQMLQRYDLSLLFLFPMPLHNLLSLLRNSPMPLCNCVLPLTHVPTQLNKYLRPVPYIQMLLNNFLLLLTLVPTRLIYILTRSIVFPTQWHILLLLQINMFLSRPTLVNWCHLIRPQTRGVNSLLVNLLDYCHLHKTKWLLLIH